AVRVAVMSQRAVSEHNSGMPDDKRIEFRVGINLGDVVIDGDDIQGDGVNVAARLESLAPPGGICISGSVHEQIRDRLDLPFDDLGEREVKNISRPVRVWQWTATASPVLTTGETLALPDKPSIAVLPFENMSGDDEQEFFADGMTDDIITELSRFEDLFVIARHSSFVFKGQRVDVKAVARELGVRFILEGSVRKAGQRVRITAQLIDGKDGGHVWAEKYDGALENVFDLQEQVTSQVVGSIALQINRAELERVGRGGRVFDEAHEHAWQAQALFWTAYSEGDPAKLDTAITMAAQAVDMNAKCGKAYEVISLSYLVKSVYRWGADPSISGDMAEAWANKFFEQLPSSYMAYHCRGVARFQQGRYREGNLDFQQAHARNPNDSVVLRFWAWCEASAGDIEGAKKHAHMAIRLSPKDANIGVAFLALAMAAFIEKDSAAFEEWADKAIQAAPRAPIRRAMMIAYAAEAGNQALLDTHRDALMRSAPDFITSVLRGKNRLFERPEHTEMLLDGLRKAGFSE
ncbi:MAG: adenylate/guanylate cyclase domain-containing protein, partial [Hyphomicrobiaceae bacterium]